MNTAAYSKAKKRLCTLKLKNIATEIGKNISTKNQKWNYKGRKVFLGDGTVIELEDTDSIRKKFPIVSRMGRQWGRPKMRFLSLFDAGTGAFVNGIIGAYTGKGQAETSLLKRLLAQLERKSILVLDRFFTNINLRKQIEDNQLSYVIRARDKRAKKALKRKFDVLVYEKGIAVRYVKSILNRPGFRSSKLYIVTNLFQEDGHSRKDIESLYLKRWSVELDIRNLKQTLEGRVFRSKSAEMVNKELWVHMLAYNLVMSSIGISSSLSLAAPRKHSFKLHVEALVHLMGTHLSSQISSIFSLISKEILNSKYRREPRAIRFLGKKYEEMKMSREAARNQNWGKSRRRDRKGLLRQEAA